MERTTAGGALGFGFGSAAALIALTVLVVPLGTSNDDVILNSLFTGQFIGEASSQGLFTHVAVGWVVATLSSAWPTVPWFALLLLLTHVVATGSLLSIVALQAGRRSLAIAAALLAVVGLDLWAVSELSWTSAAFASSAAGLAVASSFVAERLNGWAVGAWASVLIAWGAALRFESFIGAVIVASPVLLVTILDQDRRRIAIATIGCAMCLAGAVFLGQQQSLNDDWRTFAEYTAVRGPLADSTRLDSVDLNDPALAGLDFTATEVLLFDSWFFDDPEVFGQSNLTALAGATTLGVPDLDGSTARPAAASERATERGNLAEHGLKVVIVAALALLVVGYGATPLRSLGALASLGGAVVLIPVIMVVARMTGRVLVGLLITGAYVAIASTATFTPERPKAAFGASTILAASAAMSAIVLVAVIGPANQGQRDAELERLNELAAIDADGVFLLWEEPLGDLGLLGLGEAPDLDLVLNGWLIGSPPQEAQLQRLGIEDQFSAVAEQDGIYAVSDDQRRLSALADYLDRRRNLPVDVRPGDRGLVAAVIPRERAQ